jgi:hypothetical protein
VKNPTLLLIGFLGSIPFRTAAAQSNQVDFAREVRPILERACWKCHGPEKQKGGLRFDLRTAATIAGDSGRRTITPGKADDSELIRRVEAENAEERMPPKSRPLSRAEIRIVRTWIDQGALWPADAAAAARDRTAMVVTTEDRQHWSFRPLNQVEPPFASDVKWCRTAIDRFVLASLLERGIFANAVADRRVLIRRVYFDLLGLPPSPEEVKAFALDPAHDAYEKLVDRLLASPHYGERWGRHWLDVARYADSDGLESDADRPTAYHYRDFVIRTLNDDMPFDKFVRWQIAGDEYEPDNSGALAATGFLAGALTEVLTVPMEEEKLRFRFNELDDMAVTTVSAFLGLTLGCARCHDHKYDAIPTRDYYRIQCAFTTTKRDEAPLVTRAEAARYHDRVARWKARLEAAERDGRKDEIEAVKRSEPQKPPTALAIVDRQATPEPTWLLDRGDFYAKKELLQIGFLTALTGSRSPEDYWNTARREIGAARSTGQRRALGDWITDREQGAGALVARVMVNRVWQHHFGEGLVRTVSDFGVRGERPTHTELLEWLSSEFVSVGWRMKPLHRKIVTSAAYMQNATYDAERAKKDPDNRLLWRRRPQRMEGEILRDAVLSVCGTLNGKPFGPAYKPPIPSEAMLARNTKDPYPKDARDTDATRRRTVYMFHKRVVQHPLLQAFDGPDAAVSCGRRSITTVAPQALALLNDTFLRDRASDFARRLLVESEATPEGWVARGFAVALSRPPSDAEGMAAVQFVKTQLERRAAREKSSAPDLHRLRALADFAQVLFSLNEFIYVD